jgi:hypothetical protein
MNIVDNSRYRPREYDDLESGPWDPISGTLYSIFDMIGNMTMGFADVPIEIMRARRRRLKSSSSTSITSDETSSNSNPRVSGEEADPAFNATIKFQTSGGTTSSLNISNQSSSTPQHPPKTPSTTLHLHDEIPWESPPPPPSSSSPHSHPSTPKTPQDNNQSALTSTLDLSSAIALGASKGLGRIILAGFKSPFEVTLHVARGFHNLPRLYGDKTVRPPEKITGVWSGMKAVGKVSFLCSYSGNERRL